MDLTHPLDAESIDERNVGWIISSLFAWFAYGGSTRPLVHFDIEIESI
jgi:hypothetical protein